MNLLIWDFDGTLGYRTGKWSGALLELLDAEYPGHNVTREALVPLLRTGFPWHDPDRLRPGRSAQAWWAALEPVVSSAFKSLGIPSQEAEQLAKSVQRYYTDLSHWQLYPETLPALERLSHVGWTHALLSNHIPELGAILAHLGLTPHFRSVFNSAVTGFEKPHPQAFRNVLEAREPTVAWMIGDHPAADIAGAQAVGLPAVLVHGKGPGSHICADLGEVVSFFQERSPKSVRRAVGR